MDQSSDTGALDAALDPMRQQLAVDGYGLRATPDGGVLEVEVFAQDGACEDCLIPKDLFGAMVDDQLQQAGLSFDDLRVSYPVDA